MDVDELPSIDPNVDYRDIYPIQQKRMIAFINHFVLTTVSFLNEFAKSCESRLMEFEHKIQKVEASLMILESQLSSISGLSATDDNVSANSISNVEAHEQVDLPEFIENTVHDTENDEQSQNESIANLSEGPKASEDPRYKKFFKMIQFGVPSQAVKLKMKTEYVDPAILDQPNCVIPGYAEYMKELDNESCDTSSS